jgi:site-specific recombinase XerD
MMVTFSMGIRQFVETKRVQRPKTYQDYVYRVSIVLDAAQICGLADCDIRKITSQQLYDLVIVIDSKKNFPGLCENTVASIVKRIKTFFRWLCENEMISANPAERVVYRRTEPDGTLPFNDDELSAMFSLLPETDSQKRDYLIFHLAVDTGLRLNETCGLRICDLSGMQLSICGKGGIHRTVSFGERTELLLKEYIEHFRVKAQRNDLLFITAAGNRLTATTLAHRLSLWASRAGVRDAAFHRFRVSYAVYFIQNGGDPLQLQMLLGHKDLTMTRYYCRLAYRRMACNHNSQHSIMDSLSLAKSSQEEQQRPGPAIPAGANDATETTSELMFQVLQTWIALISQMQISQGEKRAEIVPALPSLAWMQLTDQFRQAPWHNKK